MLCLGEHLRAVNERPSSIAASGGFASRAAIMKAHLQSAHAEIHNRVGARYDRPSIPSLIICRPAGDKIPFPTPDTNQMPLSVSRQ
jgi:hypothetical protein